MLAIKNTVTHEISYHLIIAATEEIISCKRVVTKTHKKKLSQCSGIKAQ
jgi:hypothetical protein